MFKLKKGDTVGLVACSNLIDSERKGEIETLVKILKELGVKVVLSEYLYKEQLEFKGRGENKSRALMKMYDNEKVKAIFDISGGDLANEVLLGLDFDKIKKANKPFFGYSDLTTILNAIFSKTGQKGYLYQIRNLIREEGALQRERVKASLFEGKKSLTEFKYHFIQGEELEGVVVGGNIRCLLKLAGTPYMPEFKDKVLFLESMGGGPDQMCTFLNQYEQMGVFKCIRGIILGTFSKMEDEKLSPTIEALVLERVKHLPILKTEEIGHKSNAKAIIIGESIHLKGNRI